MACKPTIQVAGAAAAAAAAAAATAVVTLAVGGVQEAGRVSRVLLIKGGVKKAGVLVKKMMGWVVERDGEGDWGWVGAWWRCQTSWHGRWKRRRKKKREREERRNVRMRKVCKRVEIRGDHY
jgi:hypothetical protein